MLLIELFVSFLKIGLSSFGGVSMIPLILQEMTSHGWMTAEDMSNLVAIAEMTPGPIGINCATFAGTRAAGVIGGIVAVAGVIFPSLTITMCAAVFYRKFKNSTVMTGVMAIVKPVCIGVLFAVVLSLSRENYFISGSPDFLALAIGAVSLYFAMVKRWSVPKVIMLAAVLGCGGYALL